MKKFYLALLVTPLLSPYLFSDNMELQNNGQKDLLIKVKYLVPSSCGTDEWALKAGGKIIKDVPKCCATPAETRIVGSTDPEGKVLDFWVVCLPNK